MTSLAKQPVAEHELTSAGSRPPLVIITGISGAGKTSALRVFEDLGFYCIDNLPPALIETLVSLYLGSVDSPAPIAVVCDSRSGELFRDFSQTVRTLRDHGYPVTVVFLDASDETVLSRFREARRVHPLAVAGLSNQEAIARERELMQEVREMADLVIDTTGLSVDRLRDRLVRGVIGQDELSVTQLVLKSFGYKFGVPADCDFVFDCRFLPNPFYEENLRQLTGHDPRVMEWLFAHDEAGYFLDQIKRMIEFAIPHFQRVRKVNLTVGLGCTGGRHRSVALVERLREMFEQQGRRVLVVHRDINRDRMGNG